MAAGIIGFIAGFIVAWVISALCFAGRRNWDE
jgi:hypothetical protein